MLIRNVKSFADLEKKKDLQSKLLQIQIDNEELLENRVKNYQNPNKPPPVPPQYKTNAELQKDTTLQQKEVVNNLLSINGVDNFIALGVSQGLGQLPNGVGNYLIFNKNFPVIKKRLEDINKSAYGIDTFMNKIQEVLEQIELGILYNTTGGANAQTAFNQAVGAGNNLPSADLYGVLVGKLIAIKNEPTSPLQNDPDFIAIINIYQNLMNNSPSQTDIADIDFIEPLDKQRILKEMDRLMNIRGIPNNTDITAVEGNLDTNQYFAGLQQANQFAFPPQGVVLDQKFKDAYANLVRLAKNIKDPNSTIPDLGKLKDRIEKSLENRRAVQTGLQTQLLGVQQAGIQGLRNVVIGDMNTRFERTLNQKSGVRMKERLVSNTPNPYTNQLYGNDMFDYSPTLSNQPPDPTNPADIIVEVVVSKVYGAVKLPYFIKRNLIYGIMDGDGAEITKADGSSFNSIEEFRQTNPELDRFYYRNLLEINEITQQEQDAYNAYLQAQQDYQAQAGLRAKSKVALGNFLKKNPQIVMLPQPVQVAQPQQTERLVIGSEANIQAEPAYSKILTRLRPAGMKARSNIEIDALKQVLATDPLYDPVADQNQQLIQSQGYGLKKMRGGMVMCPAVYDPVMGKDGKMYSNKCQASTSGAGMKKPDAIHIDINSHNGENYKMSGDGFISRKIKIGKGIEVQEQPRYKTFGKYIVHMPHLENDNVLNFKFPSMGSIPTLKPVNVDDNFKEFIIDILNSGKVSQRHYDTLTEPEKAHFNKVIKGAGLTNSLQFKTDSRIDEKKDIKRLDVLLGEINAGNDNDKLRKECKELIKKCVNNGSIPKHKGMDFLLQIE
jgi:hypothetical protein